MKVRELITKVRECEACARRRAKLAKFVGAVDKGARDLLRRRKRA